MHKLGPSMGPSSRANIRCYSMVAKISPAVAYLILFDIYLPTKYFLSGQIHVGFAAGAPEWVSLRGSPHPRGRRPIAVGRKRVHHLGLCVAHVFQFLRRTRGLHKRRSGSNMIPIYAYKKTQIVFMDR